MQISNFIRTFAKKMKIIEVEHKPILFTKEGLEKYLGYEISDFDIEEVITKGVVSGISIRVKPTIQIERINITFKINNNE